MRQTEPARPRGDTPVRRGTKLASFLRGGRRRVGVVARGGLIDVDHYGGMISMPAGAPVPERIGEHGSRATMLIAELGIDPPG